MPNLFGTSELERKIAKADINLFRGEAKLYSKSLLELSSKLDTLDKLKQEAEDRANSLQNQLEMIRNELEAHKRKLKDYGVHEHEC